MKLLAIDSSITGQNSVSRQLTARLVEQLKAHHPSLEVTYYDLAAQPFSHLSGEVFAAQAKKPEERTAIEQKEAADSARALDDFLSADIVVVGAPMYNFSIPSQLKAWIDRVAVAGKTFRYTPNGPEGLAGGKRVIVVSTRGGFYGKDTPLAASDHQEHYLTTVFGFMGINEIEFIRAEGVSTGADNRTKAISQAEATIKQAA